MQTEKQTYRKKDRETLKYLPILTVRQLFMQASRQQVGRQAGRQTGRQAGRQAGRQSGSKAVDRQQEDRMAGKTNIHTYCKYLRPTVLYIRQTNRQTKTAGTDRK